ncbi:cyclic 2,3-diphosphoglycerate synthase, partial [Nanoarchaeota archaeon]
DNEDYKVVAFTAAQIPYIDDRKYPAELAGKLYPEGIPIELEEKLPELIKENDVDEVIFSYSDVSYDFLKEKEKVVTDAGAEFKLFDVDKTMVKSTKPVIAIVATRTGCGKSQTTRKIANILKEKGRTVVAIRHPMPYGNLVKQEVQRFETIEDLKKHECTIEEMEEYEPHIENGTIVYAGVDYEKIVREAEKEADVILWDGGNNDTPFYKPDLWITVADPLRPGHELDYYPGKINVERADVIIINKVDSAKAEDVETVRENIKKINPKAIFVEAESPVTTEDESVIKDKRVLVIEDGPTLTHGHMKIGAGTVAAQRVGVKEIVDPRQYVVGEIAKTFEKYDIGKLLPAMGYSDQQIADLQETANKVDCDAVVIGTPIDLKRLVKFDKPAVRVTYELKEITKPDLKDLLKDF